MIQSLMELMNNNVLVKLNKQFECELKMINTDEI